MYDFELTRETTASPEALWAIYAEIEEWPAWLTSFESVRPLGPFASGTEVAVTWRHDNPLVDVRFHLENVTAPVRFDTVFKVGPLITGRVTHTIERAAMGARFTHALHNTGALAAFNFINVAIARARMPGEMERLGKLADATVPDGSREPAR
jgi:hypothetical protein